MSIALEDLEMRDNHVRPRWIGVWFLAFAAAISVCSDLPAGDDAEAMARAKFKTLQSAVKAGDTEKIWSMLSDKSKSAAEKTAKDVQAAHAKAGAKDKADIEEALGMKAADIAKLTGPGYLKSKRFQKKYDELPESKIEKVAVQADGITVHYLEPDGDHEKLIFVRQDGVWKAWLGIPKIRLP